VLETLAIRLAGDCSRDGGPADMERYRVGMALFPATMIAPVLAMRRTSAPVITPRVRP